KTWWGISVFGAIALAEALHHHGDLLPDNIRSAWTERLAKVAAFIYDRFDLTFTNINYGYTALHALSLLGEVLKEPKYRARAQELAKDASSFLTEPNRLLFGETKPSSDKKSHKGLYGVDLGYNVEESLNGAVLYALREKDETMLMALTESLQGHLEFMLPDGGWDNGWGTRQYKWTYWGSRTTDGCLPAYAMLSNRVPAFGTAAYRHIELLRDCTAENGLLYGGLHYAQHDLGPCIHHTFAHAKPLAFLLDLVDDFPRITASAPLPRSAANGVKEFPEIDVRLAARGPWRATVSAYDHIYKDGILHGTGGALTMLWHEEVGPLFTASMVSYYEVERFNQQPDPDGEDYALTPRLEAYRNGEWYTNLYELQAQLAHEEDDKTITLRASSQLVDKQHKPPEDHRTSCTFSYQFTEAEMQLRVNYGGDPLEDIALVLPLISPLGEEIRRLSPEEIVIVKPKGSLRIKASLPITIDETKRERVFNMVPGVQAIPLRVVLPKRINVVECAISVQKL
ncbi:MAG: hypothetical protein AAGA31_02455, partial [Bacteroidota bacterium]